MSSLEIQRFQMPTNEMLEMAKLFADSAMFKDVSQIAQAFVKIQAGKEIGIAPFAAMSGINVIMGKVTLSAGLMAACVKGSGKYDYKVAKLDDEICSIEFYKGDKLEGVSTFTKADAIRAQTQNMSKYPRNMLFARAMSNGQKWFCPDVFTMPVYTPEELGDAGFEDIPHVDVTNAEQPVQPKAPAKAAPVKKEPAKEVKETPAPQQQAPPIETKPEPVQTPPPADKTLEQALEELIKEGKEKLQAAKDIKELAEAFKAMNPDVKKALVELKDQLKKALTPPTV